MRRPAIPLAALAAIALAGAASGACGTKSKTQTANVTEPVQRVVVNIGSGDAVVVGTTANAVKATWHARTRRANPRFDRALKDGVLTLSARCNPGVLGACKIDQRVELPAHTDVEVHSGSGSVRVERADAAVTVSTGSGSVDLVRTGGIVHAQTRSGSVNVDKASDEVSAQTDSGSVQATQLTARRVQAKTRSGSVKITFAEAPDDVDLESATGNVEASVPKGAYEVDAHSSSGGAIEVKGLDKTSGSSRHVRAVTASGSVKIAGK